MEKLDFKDESVTAGLVGCAGFIGSHLLERILSDTRWNVLGIDLNDARIQGVLPNPRLAFVKSDYNSDDYIGLLTEKCRVVCSLASLCNPSQYNRIPDEVIQSNFTNPTKLVRACADKGRWLIHFSTCEVYGKTLAGCVRALGESTVHEDSYLLKEDETHFLLGPVHAQRWCYASAKQLLERYIHAIGTGGRLPYTIVRPFNFIGPRMDYLPGMDGEGIPRVFACFMSALLGNEPLKLVGKGLSRRCYTYIDDAIDCVMNILERPRRAQGQIFNIGNPGNEVSVAELAVKMGDLFRTLASLDNSWEPEIRNVTAEEFYGPGYEDSDRRMPDISKAESLLSWKPVTDLNDTLTKSMEWFIKKYGKKMK
jgi:UDP-apiose/xylose synthase